MKMLKLPPKEKIPEAYTALEDNRIKLLKNQAIVGSSNKEKEYFIQWQGNVYYSNDAATYWQGYLGYPVIAVLMLQKKITWKKEISAYFKNVNWHEINLANKRDYKKALEYVIEKNSEEEKKKIYNEINRVYEEIKKLDIELTRKKIEEK